MGKNKKNRDPKDHQPIEQVPESNELGNSKFARALGSGDFHTRDKGLRALVLWLQRKQSVNEPDLEKIWKGIIFCFWHSDKTAVQQDLAIRLANIVELLNDEMAVAFFKTFLKTMRREWGRIDRLRLDKFMMLVRRFFSQMFSLCATHKWESQYVEHFTELIHVHAFHKDDATQPVGFGLHIADVYMSELVSAASASPSAAIPSAIFRVLLQPFVTILRSTGQPALLKRIRGTVFESFLETVMEARAAEDASTVNTLATCDLCDLAEQLSDAGAESGVCAPNRAALYDLAESFERCGLRGAAGGGVVPSKKRRKQPSSDTAHAPVLDKPAKGKRAQRLTTAALNGKQTAGTSSSPELAQAKDVQSEKCEPAEELKSVKGAGKAGVLMSTLARISDSRSPVEAAAEQQEEVDTKKKKKKGKRKENSTCSPDAVAHIHTEVTGGGENSRDRANSLSPTATRALTQAVHVLEKKPKKRITFNLKKNLVHQIGKPLPAAELRTPPSAKPNGSALKKDSDVAAKLKASRIAKQLDFGSGRSKKRSRAR